MQAKDAKELSTGSPKRQFSSLNQRVEKSADASERAPSPGSALYLDNIGHRYTSAGPVILNGLTLSVAPEEVVAIVGRSGTGKSTLLNIMAGLRKPQSGSVYAGGQAVVAPAPARILMSQHPALFPWMTVRQNVGLGLRFTGKRANAPARVDAMLELVELGHHANTNVQDLSGGQQQRVALARALAPKPDILLLDEPFSALDMLSRTRLQRLIRQTAKNSRFTVILVTHDLAEAAVMADRVFVLSPVPGKPPEEIPIDLPEKCRTPGDDAIKQIAERLTSMLDDLAMTEESLHSAQL